jgi:hypothetical protein
MNLDQKVGETVTIEGTAYNARAGAVVLTTDRIPVYVERLERWDRVLEGERVSASGTLRKRAGHPVASEGGEYSAGIPDDYFVLSDATWAVV